MGPATNVRLGLTHLQNELQNRVIKVVYNKEVHVIHTQSLWFCIFRVNLNNGPEERWSDSSR